MSQIIPLPATGWCVRSGIRCAHYLGWSRGRHWSACGGIERVEEYAREHLRPLQAGKPRCMTCEANLLSRTAAA